MEPARARSASRVKIVVCTASGTASEEASSDQELRDTGRVLTLDSVVQTTEKDEFIYHEMLAHLPIFAHGAVRKVLIVGGGDGGMLEEV